MTKNILITFALLFSGVSLAQKHELGVFFGSTGYYGDLKDNQFGEIINHQNPAIGFVHKMNLHEHVSFRSSIQVGTVKADDLLSDDPNKQKRNLSFQSRVMDVSVGFEFNFFEFAAQKRKITHSPYVYGGISYFTFNPQAKNNQGQWVDLQPIGTEGQLADGSSPNKYELSSWAIPFGLGYKVNVGDKLGISFEWAWRATATDFLDDVSGYYPDPNLLSEEAAELSNPGNLPDVVGKTRGNPNLNDWYNFAGFTLTYKIKNKLKQCLRAL